jgi:hypothetical protein
MSTRSVPHACDFFLSHGWESTNPQPLWFPTHFAQNAKWMGHGGLLATPGAPGFAFETGEFANPTPEAAQ